MVAHGSTNVYVAEELLGCCPQREQFISGQVINGVLCQTAPEEKPPIIRISRGQAHGAQAEPAPKASQSGKIAASARSI